MKYKIFLLLTLIITSSFAQNKNKTIGFKENKGQILDQNGKPNDAVKYLLNSAGLNVQIKTNGFSYDIYETKKHPLTEKQKAKIHPSLQPKKNKEVIPEYSLEHIYHRIDIDFLNSNPNVELIKEEKSKDYDNFYNVPNNPNGVLTVHRYQQITYKNIYPNIDVIFTVPKDTLKTVEYNFVIHPKGKISDIQLKFRGAETELVDNKIRMSVRFGEMEETLPASWTEDGEVKKEIAVGYKKIKKNVYGFASAENVTGKTVVIDPVPTRLWGTFYGEGDSNNFADIGTDNDGNIYFTGYTTSTSPLYATSGAHQTSVGDASTFQSDIVIAKFDKFGKRIWGTFYGGESWDLVYAIKIDKLNNVIIVGETNSTRNITTPNSFKPNLNYNSTDAFIAKFKSSGERLWGTYFGTQGIDVAFDVDTDTNNNIYVVGTTNSYSGISLNNNFQTLLNQESSISNSSNDGFMVKLNPIGNVIWGTYIGGESLDYIHTIKIASNYLVLGGKTMSKNFISTSGTFQENPFPLGTNSFIGGTVYKFTLDGNRIWSTYYGSRNRVEAIEVDDENNVYIGGTVSSSDTGDDNIATPGSFDDFNQWSEAGFLAKLDINGQRIWGTYLGRSSIIYSIIFRNNSLYIGGMGGDSSITTLCSFKKTGTAEGYIGKFTKSGQLIFGTFVSGFDQYSKNKICFENNNIVIGGQTSQEGIITDSNSYQQNIIGRSNFYLMDFAEENNCNIDANPTSNSPVCIGYKLMFNANPRYNYSWTGPNNFTSSLQSPSINNASVINNGLYTLVASDNCGCEKKYELKVIIGDIQPPVPNLASLQTITGDCNTSITTIPSATDTCTGVVTGTTTSPLFYTLPGTYTIVWNYQDGNGNSVTQEQKIIINAQPLPVSTSPQTFCIEQNATLNSIAITGQNVKWYDALTNGNLLNNSTSLQNGITYYATQTINGCESERLAVTSTIQDTAPPTANAIQSFCVQKNAKISDISILGQNINWFDSLTSSTSLSESTLLTNGTTYYASQTVNNCESTRIPILITILDATNNECINLVDEFPYPKFFTPNNDGFNDTWAIDFNYLEPNSSIRIFDRYGKLVKELRNNDSWDGTYLGYVLPATDYWFTVTRKNGSEFKSHFSLKR
jgi:gliding motility-associated-like protein